MVNKMAKKFDWFTKKKPTNTSENLPYAFSHTSSGAPPSVYMSMMTGNTFDEAMQETNNIPMPEDDMGLDIDLALDPELEDPDAIEKAIYQLRIAEEKEIEPEEVLETPYGPGLSGEEIDLLLDAYPALDAGVDLDMIDENFDNVDRMLAKSGESIEGAMDAAEQRAEDEGDIGAAPAMMRQLGDSLGTSVDAMLNPRNRGEELAAASYSHSDVDVPQVIIDGAGNAEIIFGGGLHQPMGSLPGGSATATAQPTYNVLGDPMFMTAKGVMAAEPPMGPPIPSDLMGTDGDTDPDEILDAKTGFLGAEIPEETREERAERGGSGRFREILVVIHESPILTPQGVVAELARQGITGAKGAQLLDDFLEHTEKDWGIKVDVDLSPFTSDRQYLPSSFDDLVEGYEGGTIDALRSALKQMSEDEKLGRGERGREIKKQEAKIVQLGDEARFDREFEETYSQADQIDMWRERNPLSKFTDAQVWAEVLAEKEKTKELGVLENITNVAEAEIRQKYGLEPGQKLNQKQEDELAEKIEILTEEAAAEKTEAEEIVAGRKQTRTVIPEVVSADGTVKKDGDVWEDDGKAPDAEKATELPDTPQGLMSENLQKAFYKTVYTYPEAGRSDVRDRLPYIFRDTRTLYFLYHGEHAFTDLAGLTLAKAEGDDVKSKKIVLDMEARYKSFLADYLTNPASLRTGNRFREKLGMVNEVLDYVSRYPDREDWGDPIKGTQAQLGKSNKDFQAIELWVTDLFGTAAGAAGAAFAKDNRRNLIKMAATQGGRGYYSGLIHSAVDRVMNYYKTIGWSEERIFKWMVEITSAPTTDPDRMSPVELQAQQIEQEEKEKEKEALDADVFAETQLNQFLQQEGATDVNDPEYLLNLAASQDAVNKIKAQNAKNLQEAAAAALLLKQQQDAANKGKLTTVVEQPPPTTAVVTQPPPTTAVVTPPTITPSPVINPSYLDLESGAGAGLAGFADQSWQPPSGIFEGVPGGVSIGSLIPGPEEQDYIDSIDKILTGEDLRSPIITELSAQERARRLQEQYLLAQKRTNFPTPVRQFGDFIPRGQRNPGAIL